MSNASSNSPTIFLADVTFVVQYEYDCTRDKIAKGVSLTCGVGNVICPFKTLPYCINRVKFILKSLVAKGGVGGVRAAAAGALPLLPPPPPVRHFCVTPPSVRSLGHWGRERRRRPLQVSPNSLRFH